jgi:DNA-3-methyladenine glycosylase
MRELEKPALEVARRLLGSMLVREIDGHTIKARIVETEAYDQTDAASHSFNGKTPRSEVMFGPPGHFYVYFTYGMHYCCNIVTGKTNEGSAVLIRAVEIVEGEEHILRNKKGVEAGNGPAKLCESLGIQKDFNGHKVTHTPLQLVLNDQIADESIAQTTRIGIKKAVDRPYRFYITDSLAVSKR